MLPAFLAAPVMPFFRSHSSALAKSPSFSASAFLQSIIPAPVFSRSSFTIAADTSAIARSPAVGRPAVGPRESRSPGIGSTGFNVSSADAGARFETRSAARYRYSVGGAAPSTTGGSPSVAGLASGAASTGATVWPLISTVGPRRSPPIGMPRGPRSRSGRRPKRRSSRPVLLSACWLSCSSRSLAPEAR